MVILCMKAGSNINFVKQIDDTTFSLRTYERGVEDETLSVAALPAVAIAMNVLGKQMLLPLI
jgi:diaminopimelate epimerase